MKKQKKHLIHKYQSESEAYNGKVYLKFKIEKGCDKKIVEWLRVVNKIFSMILKDRAFEFLIYAPYKVTVSKLISRSQWTSGAYVAVNKADGTLDLFLNYDKLLEYDNIPVEKMVWVFFHEFRHKIQQNDANIRSILDYPNWRNFNYFIQKRYKKDEDFVNHIFHELNPEEVDANIFASQITQVKFGGSIFDITDDTLSLLDGNKKWKK